MPEPRDSVRPREERLFARVPNATLEKIAYLAKRWGPDETLSTADVIIRLVDQAYFRAKGNRSMNVPTEKNLLQQIKAGHQDRGILPVPPDESIGVGDILNFQEATFDAHQIPSFVPNGDEISMQITKADDTGGKYGGHRLYGFRWQPLMPPQILVLLRHKNYYVAMHTLPGLRHLVAAVTGSEGPATPISDDQLREIRRRASAAGVAVKVAENLDEIRELAMLGECELPSLYW